MLGPGWLSFVLIEDPAKASRFNAYSLVTKSYPTPNEVATIKNTGQLLNPNVARAHFPKIHQLRRAVLMRTNVAA